MDDNDNAAVMQVYEKHGLLRRMGLCCSDESPCNTQNLLDEITRLNGQVAALKTEEAAGERAVLLEQMAAFWRPVARDLEHGILSIETVRFLAQDFLAILQGME